MNGSFCEYTLLDELGHGGMGTVYRAKNAAGEIVALKVMAQNLVRDKGLRERFIREPRMYPKHENIVQIMEAGECNGMPFFAMAYIQGDSFDNVLKRHRSLAPSQFVPVLRDVAAALDHVHRQGIIHRDIKPSNIQMRESDDRAFLTDFGVAKNTLGTKLTQVSGVRIGTAHYMSPEQAMGKRDLTPATDVYALGVMAYHAISGRVPFDADSDVVVARMHMQDVPPDLHKINPNIPPALSAVVMRALEKDPRKRYASAGALAAAFEKVVDNPTRVPVVATNSRMWMGLSAAVLIVAAFVAVWLLSTSRPSGSSAYGPDTATTTATQASGVAVLATAMPTQGTTTPAADSGTAAPTANGAGIVAADTVVAETSEAGVATSTLAPTSTPTNTPRPPTRTPKPTHTPTPTETDIPTSTPTPSITPTPTVTPTPKIKVIKTVRFPILTAVVKVDDSRFSPTIVVAPISTKVLVATIVVKVPIEPIATVKLVEIQPAPVIVATIRLRLPPIKIIVTKAP